MTTEAPPLPPPPIAVVAPAPPIAATAPPLPAAAPAPIQRPFTIVQEGANPSASGPLKMMVYGTYGSGKTYLAGTAQQVEQMRDVLYLDVEGGSRTLVGRGIDRIPCQNFTTLNWIKEWLIRHAQLREAGNIDGLRNWQSQVTGSVPDQPRQYRTIIIDSLSELAKLLLLELSGVKIGASHLDAQIDNPQSEEWGQLSARISLLVRTFVNLPFHIIFVASAVEKEDEVKRRFFQPNFNGKMAKDVQGFLDCVAYLAVQHNEAGESQRVLSLTPGRNYDAKHRFTGATKTQIANPSMADIFALHTGGK